MLRSAVGICAMWLWFVSISLVPITDQTALSFLAPIFTTLGAMFLKEIVRIRRWLAIIIGFRGDRDCPAWLCRAKPDILTR